MVSSESDFSRFSGLARREFLALSAGALVAAGAANRAVGADDRVIRLGVVGCGGRGTGAALQAAAADAGVRIVGLADAFADQVAAAAHILSRDAADQFDCPVTRRFSGPDAHRRVLDLGVDAVVIAAPPHLRPTHVEAAVAAGCHVFCETPAAIDLAAAARVAAALARAGVAGRVVASGFHSRRDAALAAVVDEVRAGAWGPPRSVDVHAAFDHPWQVPALAGRSPAEDRLRNWISCAALSGGAFVERHVHAIDRALWVLGDRTPAVVEPLSAAGPGEVAVRFRFEDATEIRASAMRADGPVRSREFVTTSRGARDLRLTADGSRYRATMQAFVRAIRTGRPLDEGGILLRGTIAAILGRMVAATGRPIAWEDAVASETPAFLVRQICQGVNPAEV